MSASIDQTLAQVIAARSKQQRRRARRSAAKSGLVGAPGSEKVAPAVRTQARPDAPNAEKIIVSNLPTDVNEAQIKELFSVQIGPTKEVTLHYDNAGRSKGIASVLFSRRGDGTKAYQQYHNRLIDGKRPMKVEIVLDPAKAQTAPTLSQRVGPAPAAITTDKIKTTDTTKASATRGKKKNRAGKKAPERPAKSAEDLDAEMADYTGTTTTAAAS